MAVAVHGEQCFVRAERCKGHVCGNAVDATGLEVEREELVRARYHEHEAALGSHPDDPGERRQLSPYRQVRKPWEAVCPDAATLAREPERERRHAGAV